MVVVLKLLIVVLFSVLTVDPVFAREVQSYAFIADDGSLVIDNKQVHLYGIHIPKMEKTCQTFLRPANCAHPAVLALDFKIQGFVRCQLIQQLPDRSWIGRCYYRDEDLSAYLVRQGWAMVLDGAPTEYQSLERLAQYHHLGMWGRGFDLVH